jgi:glycosyltransferase involved in cell wall biosynthesis
LTEIRDAFGEQLEKLSARFQLVSGREQELRAMLLDAHEQLLRRDEAIQAALARDIDAVQANGAYAGPTIQGPIAASFVEDPDAPAQTVPPEHPRSLPKETADQEYRGILHALRSLVRDHVPAEATLAVLSDGDVDMLGLEGRRAWHFPRNESGEFYDDFPDDAAATIHHLEELRESGADFFVVPLSGEWFVDRHPEFRLHLESQYAVAARNQGGAVYALQGRMARAEASRSRARIVTAPFGVNIAGNIASEKGTGEAVRATIRGVAAAGAPYVLNNIVDDYSDNPDQTYTEFSSENPYAFNLIQVNSDMVAPFVDRQGEDYTRGRYNIGYWFWELSEFPRQEWENSFRWLDEVWVGSNFVLDAVSRIAPVPVVKIPVSIPERLPVKAVDRGHFSLPNDRFLFLFIVDFMSIPERKNPHGLIKAFKKAFRAKDKAMLVIKGAHSSPDWLRAVGAPPNILEAITEAARDANIRIIDRVMSRDEINALIKLCDCYVSLHRSEGFGLPLAEAMSLERPVIATSYSGNMEFMTPANSFLVKYDLRELDQDYGPYRKGCVWADPDLDHAAEWMRFVYEHRDQAAAVGRRARQDIVQAHRPECVAPLIKKRLHRIAEVESIRIESPANGQMQPVS